jgi:hypothetical protein
VVFTALLGHGFEHDPRLFDDFLLVGKAEHADGFVKLHPARFVDFVIMLADVAAGGAEEVEVDELVEARSFR